jgi:hypothetical protein
VLTVVVVLVLALPGGGAPQAQRLVQNPSPSTTATPDVLTSATPTPPSTEASTVPTEEPSASPTPRPTIAGAQPRLLLSDAFVSESFASGRKPLVQVYGDKVPLVPQQTCLGFPGAPVDATRSTGRAWSWPDEVVAEELIVEYPSSARAKEHLERCADPKAYDYGTPDPLGDRLDVADGGYLVQERHELYRSLHAGARVGAFLILVEWRQSGRVTSTEPLERALKAAVSKAVGGDDLRPVPSSEQQGDPALTGYLTRAQFPQGFVPDGSVFAWTDDVLLQAEIDCGVIGDPDHPPLRTSSRVVWREWRASTDDVVGYHALLALAEAADPDTAAADFDHCRNGFFGGTPEPLSDLGDDAFYVNTDTGNGEAVVYVRTGSSYLVLLTTWQDRPEVEAFARAAYESWAASR